MADPPRLLADATAAFIDRTPIDWSALLSRVRTSPDRALFENLHALSTVRGRAAAASDATESRAASAAWMVVALGSVETAFLFALLAGALITGESIRDRTPQLIMALAFAASSVPLGMATYRDHRSLFLLATFIAVASVFTHSTVSGLPASWSSPVDRLLHGIWIDTLVPSCLWQFALGFPRVLRFTRFDRFARPVVAASWIASTLVFSFNIVTSRLGIDAGPFASASPHHSNHLFWGLFSISLAGALIVILIRARRAPSCERRKVARLALAIGGGLGPFLVLGVARTAVPAVDDWFRTPGSWGSVWLYRLIVGALAATPVLSTAAILVDRPFELQAVFRRRRRRLGVLASRVSRRTAHHDGRVAHAMERLSRARGRREAIAGLSREIRDLVGGDTVAILLPEPDGSFVEWSNAAVCLRANGALVALLRDAAEPIDLSASGTLLALLPGEDRDWVAANAVHLVAPLKRRDGGMAAIVTIGPKASGAPFDRRDRWLALALLATTAAAFDDDGGLSETSERPRAAPSTVIGEAAFECPACGLVAASPSLRCDCGRAATLASLPHWVADKFRVERRLGAGGMGVVYLARDTALDRDVALKTLPRLRPRAVALLREEARAMAALNHESLATLYGLEIWRGTPVLVVEYFPKGTLATRLSGGPLAADDAVALGIRLARALVYMHALEVQHRDLKPSNIAFTAAGAAKLLDFGLATLSRPTNAGDDPCDSGGIPGQPFAGTRGYAPPEAWRGVRSSPHADRWALAVVVLEAVAGVNPFAAAHPITTRRRATRVDLLGGGSPSLRAVPELCAFLDRALAPSPEHRFQTSGDFLAALEDVAGALAVRNTSRLTRLPTPATAPSPRARRQIP
jgi:hypothetical protein